MNYSLWSLLIMGLVACAAPLQDEPTAVASPMPTATNVATAVATASTTPTAVATATASATRRPTITPLPSERDDHPAKLNPLAFGPGGFLALQGSVETFVDEQDWLAIFVSAGADEAVTFDVELQCGGADTARVGIFDAGVSAAIDQDGNGKLSYDEALATEAVVETFNMGCLQEVSATVPGGADYYLVVHAAAGGETGYALFLSR